MNYIMWFTLYWLATLSYFYIIKSAFNENFKSLATYLPLAMAAQLACWLPNLWSIIQTHSPFSNGRQDIYNIYAKIYIISILSFFVILIGLKANSAIKRKAHLAAYAPSFIVFLYTLYAFYGLGEYLIITLLLLVFAGCGIVNSDKGFAVTIKDRCKNIFSNLFRNEVFLAVMIFLIAFLVRYFFSLRLLAMAGDNYVRASDDGLTYEPYAVQWLGGKPPEGGLYWGGYGYWIFLGLVYKLFGCYNHYAATLIQSLLGASVPLFLFYIAKRIYNVYTAVLAGILSALDINLIFLSAVIGMEALFIPMLFAIFLMIVYYFGSLKNAKLLYAAVIGMFLGFTNAVRGEIVFLPIIICVLMALFFYKKIGSKRMIAIAASLIIGFSMSVALHATRNYVNYGKFTFATGQADVCFRGGYGSRENTILADMGFNPFRSIGASASVFIHKPKEVTQLLFKGFCKRSFHFLTVSNFGTLDPIILVNPGSGYSYHYPVFLLIYGFIFMSAGVILSFTERSKLFEKSFFVCYALYTIAIYGFIMSTNARHRGILMPIFYMFAAYGMYRFFKYAHQKNAKK